MTKDVLTPEVQDVVLSFLEGLNCARSLTIAMMIRHNEWVQMCNMQCNPASYDSSDSYYRAAAATDILRKVDATVPGVDREGATFAKWVAAERSCFKTNQRFNEIMDFGTLNGEPVCDGIMEFLQDFRTNLKWLLGEAPPQSCEGRFGPGATQSDRAGQTSVPHKMSTSPTLTLSALFTLVPWTGTKWASACAYREDVPSIVRGNSYFTVNKDILSYRPCAKEPSVNGFYQLGRGRDMRRRLKRRGINLDDGQTVHRQVACAGSISGEVCTIDLTSASDMNARALVKFGLPPSWFNDLDDLRSAFTKTDAGWYRLEKFSSMGNGFTFELETAVFAAICLSVAPWLIPGKDLWVYGDDIIVPTSISDDVIWALKFCGFEPNLRKTHVNGNFRESCGGDFFDGYAVRPHFIKEIPDEPQKYISLANGIRRVAKNLSQDSRFHADLRRSWFRCLDYIPSAIRQCRGPEELGDLVIHDDESRWKTRWRANCIRYVRVYRPCKFQGIDFSRFDSSVQLAAALYGVTFVSHQIPREKPWPKFVDHRKVAMRDGVLGYKVGWLPYS
jgi:hypothetical protein